MNPRVNNLMNAVVRHYKGQENAHPYVLQLLESCNWAEIYCDKPAILQALCALLRTTVDDAQDWGERLVGPLLPEIEQLLHRRGQIEAAASGALETILGSRRWKNDFSGTAVLLEDTRLSWIQGVLDKKLAASSDAATTRKVRADQRKLKAAQDALDAKRKAHRKQANEQLEALTSYLKIVAPKLPAKTLPNPQVWA